VAVIIIIFIIVQTLAAIATHFAKKYARTSSDSGRVKSAETLELRAADAH
jgi:hypothetical protein